MRKDQSSEGTNSSGNNWNDSKKRSTTDKERKRGSEEEALGSPRAADAPKWGDDIQREARKEAKNACWPNNFPRVLPHQAVPTPWDPALRASLLPGILGLTQNSMDHEGQTIPSVPKRIKWASNSQKFNQNTKYSRTWLPHLWSGLAVLSPFRSGQTKLVFRERKMKQLYS